MSKHVKNIFNLAIIPPGSPERFLFFGNFTENRYREQLLIGGISELMPGYSVERHNYDAHEIIYLQSGKLTVKLENESRIMRPGEVLFLPKTISHHYYSQESFRMLWFHIRSSVLAGKGTSRYFLRPARFMREVELLSELSSLEERSNPEKAAISSNSLLGYLQAETELQESPHRYYNRINQFFHQMRNHLTHPWTMAEMARQVNMSQSNFFLATKEIYNLTPPEILQKMRMDLAATLLTWHNTSLKTIAEQVGYANAFSFSKAFRKYFGRSPSDFRREEAASDKVPPDEVPLP